MKKSLVFIFIFISFGIQTNSIAQSSDKNSLTLSSKNINPQQARNLAPESLARLIIPNFQEKIILAKIHPIGMDAPAPWVTEIDFYTKGKPSKISNFCTQTMLRIDFEPINQDTAFKINNPPSKAKSLTKYERYSFTNNPKQIDCKSRLTENFFDIDKNVANLGLELISDIAISQIDSKKNKNPNFQIQFEDKMPQYPNSTLYKTPNDAYNDFPLNRAFWVGNVTQNESKQPSPFTFAKENIWKIYAHEWQMTIFTDNNDKISRINIKREIPPPF